MGADRVPGPASWIEAGHHIVVGRPHPLGADLDVVGASTDDVYASKDWLAGRQDIIEATLAQRHLAPAVNPSAMALFDLPSSGMAGTHCPPAKRGYSRDGKRNRTQIEYGLLTDPAGRPVAIKVFPGNTADPRGVHRCRDDRAREV